MIITRENLNEEVSNLNDEILNLEKKYGVNIIALAQVVQLVCSAQEGFGIKPEMFFAEAIKRTVGNERVFYDADEEVPPENAGETFKKMLIKEVVENEH